MRKTMFAALLLAVSASGCASMRGVEVGSGDPVATYAIQVTNNRGGTVSVSYSAGGAEVQLGNISPQQTERYVIPAAAPMQVTVIARTTSGASAGNYPVVLEAGVTKRVTIR